MSQPSSSWTSLNANDFAALDREKTVVVLPLGASEQHGPHLSLDVDTVIVQTLLDDARGHLGAGFPLLCLPTQTVGLSTEHMAFAGTLSHSPQTLLSMWSDLAARVAHAGLKKLLFFNAHGGNQALMEVAAREIRAQHGLLVYTSSWYQLPIGESLEALFGAHEMRFGAHAGAVETSLMLDICPERVNRSKVEAFVSSSESRSKHYPLLGNGRSAKMAWMVQDYNAQGAMGDASAASAQKGAQVRALAATQLCRLIEEFSRMPLSTLALDP